MRGYNINKRPTVYGFFNIDTNDIYRITPDMYRIVMNYYKNTNEFILDIEKVLSKVEVAMSVACKNSDVPYKGTIKIEADPEAKKIKFYKIKVQLKVELFVYDITKNTHTSLSTAV